MILTCPNCDAEYEVADGMVPAAGRHVQCTACHTRWFARGSAEAAPSEEQILTRLEARPGPRAASGEPGVASAEAAPEAAPVRIESSGPAPVVALRPVEPARPAAPPPLPPAGSDTAAPPRRAAPRLDLDPPLPAVVPAPPAPAGRFGLGLAVALLLFLLALGAYVQRREIAAALPASGPALESYSGAVDGLRDRLEARIAPLRARVAAAAS